MTKVMVIRIRPQEGAQPDLAHPAHPADQLAVMVREMLQDIFGPKDVCVILDTELAEIDIPVTRGYEASRAMPLLLRLLHSEFSRDPRRHSDLNIRYRIEDRPQLVAA